MRYYFAVALLLLSSCQTSTSVPSPPSTIQGEKAPIVIAPEDIPDEMTVFDKDGKAHNVKAKELYIGGYKAGWNECLRQHLSNELDLTIDYPDPPLIQHYGVTVRGWNDGFCSCWKALMIERRHRKGSTKLVPYE